ncbi:MULTISPECIES: Gfo/Idh/MocA family protein [Saccharothrix]|uniref:Gfo/Idh/MocA family protein n=1 Tax=Saccharothrix TaxID=2071 RepID=UPI00093B9B36|nr:Gfo/Idh/MocA family oxidoreductase [Saccharothrix sp. CB00851]OKI29923.1 oxidoreductase [Saccharothrix sp. CB00851]
MLTPRPLRLGVLGCADVARRRILPAVLALPEVELVALASRDLAKARAFSREFGGEAVEGYQRVLARDDVDAVYVPLPSGLHAEWVRAAIHAGKHVLSEKPLTTNLAETRELVALARSAGVVLRENFMFVHHSSHQRVREILDSGVLGALRSFSATFTIPARPAGDIRHRRELGGGALLDVGAYPLRAAQLFLGPELTVVGAALHEDEVLGVDIGGAVLLRRDDGVTAQLTFGLDHRYTSGYRLLGSVAELSASHVFTPGADHRPVIRVEGQDRHEDHVLPAQDQCVNAVRAFVRAVLEGPRTDDSIVAQAALVDRSRFLAQGHVGVRVANEPLPERA